MAGSTSPELPSDLHEVLAASNHYEALRVEPGPELTDQAVRRAYLKRSVKIHPDKHPGRFASEASRAFQVVSAAYEALKDEGGRRYYGDELRCQRSFERDHTSRPSRGADVDGGGTSRRGFMSATEAAAVFAAAFAAEQAAGGSGGVASAAFDIHETLSVAEYLLSPEGKARLTEGDMGAVLAAASVGLRVGGAMAGSLQRARRVTDGVNSVKTGFAGVAALGLLGALAVAEMTRKPASPEVRRVTVTCPPG